MHACTALIRPLQKFPDISTREQAELAFEPRRTPPRTESTDCKKSALLAGQNPEWEKAGWLACRKGFRTGSPKPCMAAKLLASRELMKPGSTRAAPGRTLMARCSIHALDTPGLYAFTAPSARLSSTSACSRRA